MQPCAPLPTPRRVQGGAMRVRAPRRASAVDALNILSQTYSSSDDEPLRSVSPPRRRQRHSNSRVLHDSPAPEPLSQAQQEPPASVWALGASGGAGVGVSGGAGACGFSNAADGDPGGGAADDGGGSDADVEIC